MSVVPRRGEGVPPGPLFDDDVDAFLSARKGWVSRRMWDTNPNYDQWIFMPTVAQGHRWPTMITCDGYGMEAMGPCDDRQPDELVTDRMRLYRLDDVITNIDEIEEWEIEYWHLDHGDLQY